MSVRGGKVTGSVSGRAAGVGSRGSHRSGGTKLSGASSVRSGLRLAAAAADADAVSTGGLELDVGGEAGSLSSGGWSPAPSAAGSATNRSGVSSRASSGSRVPQAGGRGRGATRGRAQGRGRGRGGSRSPAGAVSAGSRSPARSATSAGSCTPPRGVSPRRTPGASPTSRGKLTRLASAARSFLRAGSGLGGGAGVRATSPRAAPQLSAGAAGVVAASQSSNNWDDMVQQALEHAASTRSSRATTAEAAAKPLSTSGESKRPDDGGQRAPPKRDQQSAAPTTRTKATPPQQQRSPRPVESSPDADEGGPLGGRRSKLTSSTHSIRVMVRDTRGGGEHAVDLPPGRPTRTSQSSGESGLGGGAAADVESGSSGDSDDDAVGMPPPNRRYPSAPNLRAYDGADAKGVAPRRERSDMRKTQSFMHGRHHARRGGMGADWAASAPHVGHAEAGASHTDQRRHSALPPRFTGTVRANDVPRNGSQRRRTGGSQLHVSKSTRSLRLPGEAGGRGEDAAPSPSAHVASDLVAAGKLLIQEAMAQRGGDPVYTAYSDVIEDFRDNHAFMMDASNIKVAVCVTVFNEEELEVRRTLEGISLNMGSWNLKRDEVIVSIVADGRVNLSKSLKDLGDECGFFNSEVMSQAERDIDSGAPPPGLHVFENPAVGMDMHTHPDLLIPLVFAIKERNAGKLSSHAWFFESLCEKVQPEVVILIDAGTQPKADALAKFWEAFEEYPKLGGCCGELKVFQPRITEFVNSAQQFEYKMSHIMDKAMESVFGYVSVLPGAFSAYRYKAILGQPLDKYFYGERSELTSPFLSNMYLAEDRILGFEVLAKADCDWQLKYLHSSVADTDVPDSIVGLVKQRRRWLNGAFFTLLYTIINYPRILLFTSHSVGRKLLLFTQLLYMLVNLLINWLTVANMYLSVYIVMSITFPSHVVFIILLAYWCLWLVQFVLALGTQPMDFKGIYTVISVIHGTVMWGTFIALIVYLVNHASLGWLFIVGFLGIFCYMLAAIMYGESCFILASAMQYIAMVPTFMSVIGVYSFCNVHDVSWGTREANDLAAAAVTEEQKQRLKEVKAKQKHQALLMRRARFQLVSIWLITNWAFLSSFVQLGKTREYAIGVVCAFGLLLGYRTLGTVWYRLDTLVTAIGCLKRRRQAKAAARRRRDAGVVVRVIKTEPVRVPQPRAGVALSDISTDASDELGAHQARSHMDVELGDVESVGSHDDGVDVVSGLHPTSRMGASSASLRRMEDAQRPRASRGTTASSHFGSSSSLARGLRKGRDREFGSKHSLHSERSSRSRRDRPRQRDRDDKANRARAAEAVL